VVGAVNRAKAGMYGLDKIETRQHTYKYIICEYIRSKEVSLQTEL
jgi:hypothetical protein